MVVLRDPSFVRQGFAPTIDAGSLIDRVSENDSDGLRIPVFTLSVPHLPRRGDSARFQIANDTVQVAILGILAEDFRYPSRLLFHNPIGSDCAGRVEAVENVVFGNNV